MIALRPAGKLKHDALGDSVTKIRQVGRRFPSAASNTQEELESMHIFDKPGR